MEQPTKLLRLYTSETAYFGDRKVFEVIAERARDAKLAGATVLTALIGFGRTAHLHGRHILDDDRSVVVEIVDGDAALRRFVDSLDDLPQIGLATLETVDVLVRSRP